MNKKYGARAELARLTLQGREKELPWKRDWGSQGIKPKYNINEGAEPMFCSIRMLLSAQRLHRYDHVDCFGRLERSRWSYGNQPIKELNFAIASTPIIRIVLRPLKMRFHIIVERRDVLGASSSHILLPSGDCFLVLVNDLVRGRFAYNLAHWKS